MWGTHPFPTTSVFQLCYNIFPLKRHTGNKGTQGFFKGTKVGAVWGKVQERWDLTSTPQAEKAIVLRYPALDVRVGTRTRWLVTQKQRSRLQTRVLETFLLH